MKRMPPGTLIALSLAIGVASWIVWHPRNAAAGVGPSPFMYVSGLVGVASGQSVQINVTRIPVPSPGPAPPDTGVTVELAIVDANGFVVARSRESLLRGRSASLTLDRDSLGTRTDLRIGLWGGAAAVPDGTRGTTDDIFVPTFEVFDNASSRTTIVMGKPPDAGTSSSPSER